MKINEKRKAVCPKCGKVYYEIPTLSREDGKSLICPDCGILEALQSLGLDENEQQHILRTIHSCTKDGEYAE